MNPLRENRAKHKLQRREIVTCIGGMNLMTSEVIDYIGQFGFDAAWIETTLIPLLTDLRRLKAMSARASASGVPDADVVLARHVLNVVADRRTSMA